MKIVSFTIGLPQLFQKAKAIMERDRRHYPRKRVLSHVVVSLAQSKVALLFDLSEGGLSVHGLIPQNQRQFSFVTFELPEGEGSIVARAETSWADIWRNRSGLRFVQLGEESRQQLRRFVETT